MLVGYMRVSKADGPHGTDVQRRALLAAGVTEKQIYKQRLTPSARKTDAERRRFRAEAFMALAGTSLLTSTRQSFTLRSRRGCPSTSLRWRWPRGAVEIGLGSDCGCPLAGRSASAELIRTTLLAEWSPSGSGIRRRACVLHAVTA